MTTKWFLSYREKIIIYLEKLNKYIHLEHPTTPLVKAKINY